MVTLNGGCSGVSVGPASGQISSNPLIFGKSSTLTVSAPAGSTITVSQTGAANQVFTTSANNTTVIIGALTGPITITVSCGNTFPITVNTSPAGIGATVTLTPGGQQQDSYTNATATAGNYTASVSSATITGATTEYRLKSAPTRWSFNSSPHASWNGTTTPSQAVSAAATFTANYDLYYEVTVNLTVGCTVNASSVAGIGPGSSRQTFDPTS